MKSYISKKFPVETRKTALVFDCGVGERESGVTGLVVSHDSPPKSTAVFRGARREGEGAGLRLPLVLQEPATADRQGADPVGGRTHEHAPDDEGDERNRSEYKRLDHGNLPAAGRKCNRGGREIASSAGQAV